MTKWIICSGPDWFRPSVTSTRQIIYQYRKNGYNILWVNPVAFKSPSVNSANNRSKRKKILNKLITHLKVFSRSGPGFYIYVPFYIPLFTDFWDKINAFLIKMQMAVVSAILGIKTKNTTVWISGSFTLLPILSKNYKCRIYQAADLISDFRTGNQELLARLKSKEIRLSASVDYLFACSPNIKSKLSNLTGREVTLLTHGVNFEHFNKSADIHPSIQEIKSKGLPIAGYFGTLSDANDKEVFRILAENGFSVVVAGKVLGDYEMLEGMENVIFTGPIPFEQLPSFARGFDVCLMNWIMADWIRNSYPVKTLEYMAMGKPIVSSRIPAVEQLFGDLVYFAETPGEFLSQARRALADDCAELAEKRTRVAAGQTWEKKFREITEITGS